MARYDKALSRRIVRALELVQGDLKEAFSRAEDLGFTPEALEQFLLDDLNNDGPIFGKLKSNLMGASEQSVIVAHEQGVTVGEAIESGEIDIYNMTDEEIAALASGEDPELMQATEDSIADRAFYTWVAMLVNSCPYCVALHGSRKTKEQWRAAGLHPETIHADKGINAKCYCRLALSQFAEKDPMSTAEPLRRTQIEGANGVKGNRRTQRAVTQRDPVKALAAVDKALQTKSGKATLRILGNQADPDVAAEIRAARQKAREDEEK